MKRMLGAELTAHLGYEAGADNTPPEQSNRRNAVSTKSVKGFGWRGAAIRPMQLRRQLRARAGEERPDPDQRSQGWMTKSSDSTRKILQKLTDLGRGALESAQAKDIIITFTTGYHNCDPVLGNLNSKINH